MKLKRYFTEPEYRAFCKMRSRHRRELVKLAKHSNDFDYEYIHELVVLKLKHFLEYYSANNNVWMDEDTRHEIINSLEICLNANNEILESLSFSDTERFKKFYNLVAEYITFWWD